MKYEFLSQSFGIVASSLARISFATFLLKFWLTSRIWRWTIWSIILSQAVVNALILALIFLQCEPVTMLWDANAGGKCWSPQVGDIVDRG